MSFTDYAQEQEELRRGLIQPSAHLGGPHIGESQADYVTRVLRESEERAAAHDAEIERHKREGTHVPGASVAGDYSPQDIANGRGG